MFKVENQSVATSSETDQVGTVLIVDREITHAHVKDPCSEQEKYEMPFVGSVL